MSVVGLGLLVRGSTTCQKGVGPVGAVVLVQTKILLLFIGVLLSVVVGLVAAILMRMTGASPAAAALKGGGAFTASMLVWIGLLSL
ncbi:hypothetical protein ACFUIW_04515 [Streptomyces sp. NPDC057245]|uniref:hypothetical protein n=1 Tax=Streptomyces sp. NPDC057245 TaxID=3346065 RepID=UPI00362C97A3